MPLKFVMRFLIILFAVLILAATVIQFFFSSKLTTDLWIILVPLILGVPILASVVLTKDDELNIHSGH